MSLSKNLAVAYQQIAARRGHSVHSRKGAVMLKCRPVLLPDSNVAYGEELDKFIHDIQVYYPKNKDHFWLGKMLSPHLTIHHGFELSNYEKDGSGEQGFLEDINDLISALDEDNALKNPTLTSSFQDRLLTATLKASPSYFPANPATLAAGEDNYYTVLLSCQPTAEMDEFHNALLKVFPHTTLFSDWKVHVTIATVPDERSRDALLAKLKECDVIVEGLKVGYNIKRD